MTNHSVDAKVHFFASHSWTHNHRREGLHAILQPWVRGLDFQDYSISRAHPLNTDTDPELARELRDIIRHMDALLIMAGMYANNSPWMQFEIHVAFAFGVPIIPILANGQVRVPRLPTRLATIPPIRWRGDSIRDALLCCVSLERRQVIEARVAFRVAVAEGAERQRREAEAARRAPRSGVHQASACAADAAALALATECHGPSPQPAANTADEPFRSPSPSLTRVRNPAGSARSERRLG